MGLFAKSPIFRLGKSTSLFFIRELFHQKKYFQMLILILIESQVLEYKYIVKKRQSAINYIYQ